MRTCAAPNCTTPLPPDDPQPGRLYCSGRCKSAAARARRTTPVKRNAGPRVKDTPPRICERCGTVFQPVQPLQQRYCSRKCRRDPSPRPPVQRPEPLRTVDGRCACLTCGTTFTPTTRTGSPRVYCSKGCRKKAELLLRSRLRAAARLTLTRV